MAELIACIIGIISIVCFFILCKNVNQIRNSLNDYLTTDDRSRFKTRFYTILACGKKEDAQNLLAQRIVDTILSLRRIKGCGITEEHVLKAYSNCLKDCELQLDREIFKKAYMTNIEYQKYIEGINKG